MIYFLKIFLYHLLSAGCVQSYSFQSGCMTEDPIETKLAISPYFQDYSEACSYKIYCHSFNVRIMSDSSYQCEFFSLKSRDKCASVPM